MVLILIHHSTSTNVDTHARSIHPPHPPINPSTHPPPRPQLNGLKYQLRGHIVAELRDVDNEHIINMAANWSAETVVAHDVVGRLMLNAARQPGLAQVYDALLGFQVCAAAKLPLSCEMGALCDEGAF